MKKISCVVVLITLFGKLSFSQSDTIKNGYRIEYVDAYLRITSVKKASFYRYIFYGNNNIRVTLAASISKKMNLKIDGNQLIKDSIVLMDGTYRLYDRKERLILEEVYDQGKVSVAKTYDKKGQMIELIDYTKKYNGQEGSAYFEFLNDNKSPFLKGYIKEVNGKWIMDYFP